MAEQRTRAASTSADEKDEKPQTPTQAVREAVQEAKADAAPEEDTYTKEHLIANSEAWGLGPSFITAGALSSVITARVTLSQAHAAIDAFLKTEAPTEVS